uniref:C-type lectin domain-containing protein n=1 Tax=Plectus sambesii TaxID=2011161 RepID=A0A914UQX7_9BILA
MLASALQLALQNSFMNSYVFAFTDSNAQTSTTETRAMLSLLGLAERTRATINVITTSTPICGPDPNTKTGLAGAIEEIIAYSGGDIYNTDDTGNFMKFIPTFYDSGLTYINYQDDCSSKNLTIYFPVDGWTQSFTAAIYGTTPSITVYRPDGNSTYLTYYNVPVIEPSSTAPNLLLRQTIIPCGEGSWANRDPYCYKVEYIPKNWTTGRDFCHQSMMMGFMSDVHSSDVQSFLDVQTGSVDYWIGLNSLKTQGQWEWDVPDGAAYSHLDGYTNWAPGEPANDPNLRCVQVRHSGSNVGVWYAADCAQTFPYFCQKHRCMLHFYGYYYSFGIAVFCDAV